jgi:hypothetical protein
MTSRVRARGTESSRRGAIFVEIRGTEGMGGTPEHLPGPAVSCLYRQGKSPCVDYKMIHELKIL